MRPEIRETAYLPDAALAVAQRQDDGRIVVFVQAGLAETERKAAVREALRVLSGRRRGRRILVLVPAALVAACGHLLSVHRAKAVIALGAALSAGVVVFAKPAVTLLTAPSSPQPGVTSAQPQRAGTVTPRALHALPGGAVPGSSALPGTAVQAIRGPSPRPSPGQSAASGGHASPSPSAPPVIPSPLVSVSAGLTGSPSPSPSGVVCVRLLVRLCV